MADWAADPAELFRAAAALRTLAAEYREAPFPRYWMASGETGYDDLAVALAEFQQVSGDLARTLPADVEETAYRLAGTAAAYQHTDAHLAEQLGRAHR